MPEDQLSDPNLKSIYDLGMATREDIKTLSDRFDKHSGEGEGTTHAALNKRMANTEMRIYGLGLVGAFIMAKWKSIFGG